MTVHAMPLGGPTAAAPTSVAVVEAAALQELSRRAQALANDIVMVTRRLPDQEQTWRLVDAHADVSVAAHLLLWAGIELDEQRRATPGADKGGHGDRL